MDYIVEQESREPDTRSLFSLSHNLPYLLDLSSQRPCLERSRGTPRIGGGTDRQDALEVNCMWWMACYYVRERTFFLMRWLTVAALLSD